MDHKAISAPYFDIVDIQQALGQFDCLVVGIANDGFESDKMPVRPDGISPVLCHRSPHCGPG
jgi:hypothetical protein